MQNNNQNQVQVANNEVVAKKEMLNVAFKQAQFYAASTIVPREYQNNPSNCFIAIEMANRMGANPFQIMQSLNIIQGRPSWSSSFIIATINQCGRFKTQLNYKMTGSWANKDLKCVAYATSNDGTVCESIPVTYQMAEAEGWINKNGSKWKTMPELMARYRAASFFGKQFCPDLLLGLMTTEEQRDIIDVDPDTVVSKEVANKSVDDVKKHQEEANASIKPNVTVDFNTGEVRETPQPQEPANAPQEDPFDDWTANIGN